MITEKQWHVMGFPEPFLFIYLFFLFIFLFFFIFYFFCFLVCSIGTINFKPSGSASMEQQTIS